MRAEGASTSHSLPLPPPFILSPTRLDAPSLGIPPPLPISIPTSSPPLLLPSASRREDIPEVTVPPRKREIRRDPKREVGYGITDLWDEIVETLHGALDTDEYITRIDYEQSQDRLLAVFATMFCLETDEHMHIHVIRWRQSLDCPERLGVSTERGDSTTGTGDHLAGAGDSITGIGHSTIGTGYRTTGTAGTR
ncbi:hypothetical protein Tco_0308508 [Tanacetum coccineum]